MKLQSKEQLYEELDRESSWRKRELVTFEIMSRSGRDHQAEAIRRAGVALLYAHWEGFIKACGTCYVNFVSYRRLKNNQLASNFLALTMKAKLSAAAESNKAVVFNSVAKMFTDGMVDDAEVPWDGSIQTKSNLSAERFQNIVISLGLDYSPYAVHEKTVIERIRDDRNEIAHGKYLAVKADDYKRLHDRILELMNAFKSQIIDAVRDDRFLR
jgi:hypothetical protein